MLGISIRSNIDEFGRTLNAFAQQQLPYAASLAINALAKDVVEAERENMRQVLDRPTPFTLNSIRRVPATKRNLVATVFVMDTAAAYLEPYEEGGLHKLIGKGVTWLNPKKGTPLNQYGNLTKSQLRGLKSRRQVFVGSVRGKDGENIGGVWLRPKAPKRAKGAPKAKGWKVLQQPASREPLKLLIRFGDAMPVKQHLDYRGVAIRTVQANLHRRMAEAVAKAVATAR